MVQFLNSQPPWWLLIPLCALVILVCMTIWRRCPYESTYGQTPGEDLWCVFTSLFWNYAAFLAAIILWAAHNHGIVQAITITLIVTTAILFLIRIAQTYRWGVRRGGNVLLLILLVVFMILPAITPYIMGVEAFLLLLVRLV